MSNSVFAHPIIQFKPTRSEAGKLSGLMRRIDELREEYANLAVPHKEYWEYFSKYEPINAEIDALAAEIGKRTLGELPLTLRTDWSDEVGEEPVVVLSVNVGSGWDTQYTWCGKGVRLRKDGSISLVKSTIRLDNEQVWRRQLDGGWTPLVARSGSLYRANKC